MSADPAGKAVTVALEPIIAGTLAGLGIWAYKDSNAVDSVSRCAKAYYSYDRHSRESAFVKCMKTEFPNTFSKAAQSFAKIEDFESQ